MKYLFFLLAYLLSTSILQAQIDSDVVKKLTTKTQINEKDSLTWKKGSIINLGFNSVGLSNWAGGGQNSISIQGLISLYANYYKDETSWDNNFDVAFGVIKSGVGSNIPWFKNDDRIELNSKIGHRLNNNWYYSGLVNFRTQFTYGYNTVEDKLNNNYFSNLFAPAYSIIALGLDNRPNELLTCFISPITIKNTFVFDDSLSSVGAFGVDPEKLIRSEVGGYIKFAFIKKEPFNIKDISFRSNLTLFSNYINEPQNIDVTWETLTSLKIGKSFSLTLSTYLIYDHDINIPRFQRDGIQPVYLQKPDGSFYLDSNGNKIQAEGPITQFKQAMGMGISLNF